MSRLDVPLSNHLSGNDRWVRASRQARDAFRKRMEGKRYSREHTITAWEWFYSGWVDSGPYWRPIQWIEGDF